MTARKVGGSLKLVTAKVERASVRLRQVNRG
jgi:hypothetical protein